MAQGKIRYRVMLVSHSEKMRESIAEILKPSEYEPVIMAHDAGEARRKLLNSDVNVIIINTPLSDDFGIDLAYDAAQGTAGVLLLVKAELYEQVCFKVEDEGIATMAKPVTKQGLYDAVKMLSAVSARLMKMEKRNRSLQEKMEDIRTVNRAKWLLIEHKNMSEKDAHYYIEKQAMDMRLSRREVSEQIIRTYDS